MEWGGGYVFVLSIFDTYSQRSEAVQKCNIYLCNFRGLKWILAVYTCVVESVFLMLWNLQNKCKYNNFVIFKGCVEINGSLLQHCSEGYNSALSWNSAGCVESLLLRLYSLTFFALLFDTGSAQQHNFFRLLCKKQPCVSDVKFTWLLWRLLQQVLFLFCFSLLLTSSTPVYYYWCNPPVCSFFSF